MLEPKAWGVYTRTKAFQEGQLLVLAHFVSTEGDAKRAPALRVSSGNPLKPSYSYSFPGYNH
jgi:hypothetical protein